MNNPAAPQSHHHGIWSTMKNLMKQGHHLHHHHHHTQHPHGHSLSHQFSHAHVYTLAGNPPNVVDFTSKISNPGDMPKEKATAAAASATNNNRITKRPWSKQSRALRNATMNDITAQGMIRSSSSSGGGGMASLGINTAAGNIHINASSSSSTSSTTTIAASSNNPGFKRLWRGVQTMFVGCIPAHALYFSSYEFIKSICTDGGHHAHHADNHSSEQQQQHQQQHQHQ